MNGVLPELTWGTWGDAVLAAPNAIPVATHALIAEPSSSIDPVNLPDTDGSAKSRRKLHKKGLRAPSDSRRWFQELQERVDTASFGSTQCAYSQNPLTCSDREGYSDSPSVIPWDALPEGIHPRDGKLPPARARNKRQQVENLAVFLRRLLRPGDVVVEFCAGSGYVALPLACLFPQCTFVLLDKKEPSLAIAEERVAAAALTNVQIFCGFVDEYTAPFDVGIALHACGEATDMALQKCIDARAAYVLAPCCVGKVQHSALSYPRSEALTAELSRAEYEVLARAADFGHSSELAVAQTEVNRRRRRCKTLLESDRNTRAREAGYASWLFVMHPRSATPKNDVLVGVPLEGVDQQHRRFDAAPLTAEAAQEALFGEERMQWK